MTKKNNYHWVAYFNAKQEGVFARRDAPNPRESWTIHYLDASFATFDKKLEAQAWLTMMQTTAPKKLDFHSNFTRNGNGRPNGALVKTNTSSETPVAIPSKISSKKPIIPESNLPKRPIQQKMVNCVATLKTIFQNLRPSVRAEKRRTLTAKVAPFTPDIVKAETIQSPNQNAICIYTDGHVPSQNTFGIHGFMLMRGSARRVSITATLEPDIARQELRAIIAGLTAVTADERQTSNVILATDRTEFIEFINYYRLDDWYHDNCKTITNGDLWKRLFELMQLFTALRFIDIKSHAGNTQNQYVHNQMLAYSKLLINGDRIIPTK